MYKFMMLAVALSALLAVITSFNLWGIFLVALILFLLWIKVKLVSVRIILVLILICAVSARFTGIFSGPSEGNREKNKSKLSIPYRTVSIRSVDTGEYMTCDIGEKDNKGRYTDEKMDEPVVRFNSKLVDKNELFELIPCSDERFALRSVVNRKYFSRNSITFSSDLINGKECIEIIQEEKRIKLKFSETGEYILIMNGSLSVTENEHIASVFELDVVSENAYTEEDIEILQSSDWFDRNGSGYGYWNIQEELGKGKSYALKDSDKLGYTLLKNSSINVIGIENLQCVIGVKEENGQYDVIIAFQGTGGYGTAAFDTIWDAYINLVGKNHTKNGKHQGYSRMTEKLIDHEDEIKGDINGSSITLSDLIKFAREGNAHFTLLGHSMGGAIAELYAIHLNEDMGIDKNAITGRTFNSSPALDHEEPGWSDWYNLCVSTDTVSNGLVPGSIRYYGIHRLGHTIWLYDDEPDQNNERGLFFLANIANDKHNMDRTLERILRKSALSYGEEEN